MTKNYIPILVKAVIEASSEILKIYNTEFEIEIKSDNSPVTQADKISSKILVKHLSKTGVPIISEEEEKLDYEKRKHLSKLWLVDPIDGTKEFIKRSGQFCISIGLIEDGQPILGLIANPTKQTILFGGKGIGAYCIPYDANDIFDAKWQITPKQNLTEKVILHSNGGYSGSVIKFVRLLEEKHGKLTVIKKGSALKFFDLVKGKADFYIRLAPTMEWDIAGGQAIYEALGGEVLHFESRMPLTYNKPQLKNPYFIAKRKNLKV